MSIYNDLQTSQSITEEYDYDYENAMKTQLHFSVPFVLRLRYGLTQMELAQLAGVSQCDISEMEKHPPCGRISKFQRLANFFCIPIDAILNNDFNAIPEGVLSPPEFNCYPEPNGKELILGRRGEEYALKMEQEALSNTLPALRDLVLPFYKMKYVSYGFDILTFNDKGQPVCMEVKTLSAKNTIILTRNERNTAKKMISVGIPYIIRVITGLETKDQTIIDIPFEQLEEDYQLTPIRYSCSLKRKRSEMINGIAFYRRLRGLKQEQLANFLGIAPYKISLYENGIQQPKTVGIYRKAAMILDTTVEELLRYFPASLLDEDWDN